MTVVLHATGPACEQVMLLAESADIFCRGTSREYAGARV